MPDLHSVPVVTVTIFYFVALRLLVAGRLRNLHIIPLVLAMLLHLARRLTLSLRLTLLLLLAFLAQVIRSFPPSLSVITLIPLQSYHASGTLGCW